MTLFLFVPHHSWPLKSGLGWDVGLCLSIHKVEVLCLSYWDARPVFTSVTFVCVQYQHHFSHDDGGGEQEGTVV